MGNVWMAITVIAHTNQGSTGCLMPQPHINMYLHCNNYYFKCERFNEGLSSGLTWLEPGNGWTVKWFSRSNCSHFMEEVLYLETIIISWNSRLSQCPEEFSNDTYAKWYCGLLARFLHSFRVYVAAYPLHTKDSFRGRNFIQYCFAEERTSDVWTEKANNLAGAGVGWRLL